MKINIFDILGVFNDDSDGGTLERKSELRTNKGGTKNK